MTKKKPLQAPRKTEVSIVRSSAAEYLTFVAATGSGNTNVEMRYEDENLWLTQKMMATLYDVSVPAISQHLKRIFADNELEREATVKQYLMVQTEGEREVQRKVDHYSLQAIIAVGFKIENERAVQFRKWANQIVKDYTIQGWVMDVDRLKSGGSVLTDDTCHFLAADFDEAEWREDAKSFLQSCRELGVPAALEISRSGNGAHAWIFFTGTVSARDARRLGTAIISHTCARTGL